MRFAIKKIDILILFVILFCIKGCGTFYVPQILPEARGFSKSEGQEKISVKVIPLTLNIVNKANEDDYIRRVIDSGDLSRAARLISIEEAIDQKLPTLEDPGPYRLGVGDSLTISQVINVPVENGINKQISSRQIFIADDGYASILGVGRVRLEGKTQYDAESKIQVELERNLISPEFELYISSFNSKKIYVNNNVMTKKIILEMRKQIYYNSNIPTIQYFCTRFWEKLNYS